MNPAPTVVHLERATPHAYACLDNNMSVRNDTDLAWYCVTCVALQQGHCGRARPEKRAAEALRRMPLAIALRENEPLAQLELQRNEVVLRQLYRRCKRSLSCKHLAGPGEKLCWVHLRIYDKSKEHANLKKKQWQSRSGTKRTHHDRRHSTKSTR